MTQQYNAVLTIAGSDSGGGAGIQADIKSISACGGFAASAITATTAQNTQGVRDIHAIPLDHVEQQLDAVLDDIAFGAVKIGMLHSCEIIQLVRRKLKEYQVETVVLDPVMVATSGDRLLSESALGCLLDFLPSATLITPNHAEAELILGRPISPEDQKKAAEEIAHRFQTSVLLKGGHFSATHGKMQDVLYNFPEQRSDDISLPFVETTNTHGTGCSLSSSIATFLGQGNTLEEATRKGCSYVNQAIAQGKDRILGKGNGPINHFGH